MMLDYLLYMFSQRARLSKQPKSENGLTRPVSRKKPRFIIRRSSSSLGSRSRSLFGLLRSVMKPLESPIPIRPRSESRKPVQADGHHRGL